MPNDDKWLEEQEKKLAEGITDDGLFEDEDDGSTDSESEGSSEADTDDDPDTDADESTETDADDDGESDDSDREDDESGEGDDKSDANDGDGQSDADSNDDESTDDDTDTTVQVPVEALTEQRRRARQAEKRERELIDKNKELEEKAAKYERQAEAAGIELSADSEFTTEDYKRLVDEGREEEAEKLFAMSQKNKELEDRLNALEKNEQAEQQAEIDDAIDSIPGAAKWKQMAINGDDDAWNIFVKVENDLPTIKGESFTERFERAYKQTAKKIQSMPEGDSEREATGKTESKGKPAQLDKVSGAGKPKSLNEKVINADGGLNFDEYDKLSASEKERVQAGLFS